MNYSRAAFSHSNDIPKLTEEPPLTITNCGFYIAQKQKSLYNQRLGNEWLLLYLHQGQIKLKNGQYIESGNVLIFSPYTHVSHYFVDNDINERYYVYFKGTHAQYYLSQFLLADEPHIFNIGLSNTLIAYFTALLNDFRVHSYNTEAFRVMHLMKIFNHIHKKLPTVIHQKQQNEDINCLIDYMETNYWDKLNLDKYADLIQKSVPTVIRLFKQNLNCTPHQYLCKIRLQQAQHLLSSTDLSIDNIAIQVGFEDTLYFRKVFKKTFSVTPTEYRTTHSTI